jgi:hypothetical protein
VFGRSSPDRANGIPIGGPDRASVRGGGPGRSAFRRAEPLDKARCQTPCQRRERLRGSLQHYENALAEPDSSDASIGSPTYCSARLVIAARELVR